MSGADEIENEIERTRSEMTGTLHAIERKLSPNRLVDEAMESMRNVNLSDSRLMDLVRDNPIPLALVGLGVGWLVVASLRGSSSALASDIEDYAEDVYPGGLARGVQQAEEWAGYGAGGGDGQRASNLASKAKERIGEVAENISGTAQQWTQGAQTRFQQMGGRVSHLTRHVSRRAGDLADRTTDAFQEHPITIGLLGAVAGIALGAALPRSRREMEMLGDTSADILESARESGRKALRRAGRVMQRAAEAVGEGGSVAVQRTKEAVEEEARRQDLPTGGTATTH